MPAMDCDVDISRFTEVPYVVERCAQGVFADIMTEKLARAGLRLDFGGGDGVLEESERLVASSLIGECGVISRTGTVSGDGNTVLVSGPHRVDIYSKAPQSSISMASDAWVMAGHALVSNDRSTAFAFASLMAVRGGANDDTLRALSSRHMSPAASFAWNVSAKTPHYIAKCRADGRLDVADTDLDGIKTASIKLSSTWLDRVASAGDEPSVGILSKVRSRMIETGTVDAVPGKKGNPLSTRIGGERGAGPSSSLLSDEERMPKFEAKPFGTRNFGPSYLPLQRFNAESLRIVQGIHPDLLKVVARAVEISDHKFQVVPKNGGMRSAEMQRKLKRKGASKAKLGRHTIGYAIDLVPVDDEGQPNFRNLKGFDEIKRAMKLASEELGIPIDWGGSWKKLVDKPHYELNRKVYPGPGEKAMPEKVLVAFK